MPTVMEQVVRAIDLSRKVLLGSLSNDDGEGNENGKKAINLD